MTRGNLALRLHFLRDEANSGENREDAMTEKNELIDIVGRIYKARKDNDIDGLMQFVDPACSFRIIGSPVLGDMTQRAADPDTMRNLHKSFMDTWDFCNIHTVSIHVDGDTVFAHHAGEISFVPSGACFGAEFLDKMTFRDGRVIDVVQFIDTLQAADVMGLVKIQPKPAP